jgi:hypothetical protein
MNQIPVGSETPIAGCVHDNGFNVCDLGPATFRQVYLREKQLLGPPVSSAGLNAQSFTHGKLLSDPGAPEGWTVQWANLGHEDLIKNGFMPQPGAELHPAVRDWLTAFLEQGGDPGRVVGRILSRPIPDPTTNQCRVWTDKTKFVFPCEATSGAVVQRAALGVESLPAPPPTPTPLVLAAQPESGMQMGPGSIVALLVILALGLALLRTRLSRSGSGANWTN